MGDYLTCSSKKRVVFYTSWETLIQINKEKLKKWQHINLRSKKEKGVFFFTSVCPRSPPSSLLHASYIVSSFDRNYSQSDISKSDVFTKFEIKKRRHFGPSFGHSLEHMSSMWHGPDLLALRTQSSRPSLGRFQSGQELCFPLYGWLCREQEEDKQGDVFWNCHASYRKAVRHINFCVALITCSYLCGAFLALLFEEEWWNIRPTCRNPQRHHDPSSFCLFWWIQTWIHHLLQLSSTPWIYMRIWTPVYNYI